MLLQPAPVQPMIMTRMVSRRHLNADARVRVGISVGRVTLEHVLPREPWLFRQYHSENALCCYSVRLPSI
jgi:hypothetical protein